MAELATFDSIPFKPIVRGGIWRPRWTREHHVSVKHILYSDFDDVQSGGSGDWTITLEAYLATASDHDELVARQDATLRPLALFGDNFAGAMLWKVEDGKTYHLDEQQTTVKLTFRRPFESAAVVSAPATPLIARFTADVSVPGEATFNPNTSSSPTGTVDKINYEFGDGTYVTITGPWAIGSIPTTTHVYATPGIKTVNCSVELGGNTSADESKQITIT
ncbi:MAG TPA: PKD domain-containing protein [Chloroflexota bacterium]|nr:PKD domain-containing protein [Chloroflexota bacterium]